METHSVRRVSFAGLRCMIAVLMLLLTVVFLSAPAYAAGCDYQIDLAVTEQEQPNLSDPLFGGMPEERYYLTLEGEFLVSAENKDDLTDLVLEVASRYVNNSTISCRLADEEQLQLYHGSVSMWAPTDLEAAAETLLDELNFITVEETFTDEVIPYERVTQEDPERYTDEEPIVLNGTDGLSVITRHATCENGIVVTSEVVDTQVAAQPIDEVTVVGTKEHLLYIWPVQGRISSHFGPRNIVGGSKNHKGVDIAVSKGTEVVAARAGTVICSKWSGAFGYLIQIEHEDGAVTYYAHNSQLIAQVGDVVEQGDVVALSGSTGQSTGPHCHFEIRIDGSSVDPEDYLEPMAEPVE